MKIISWNVASIRARMSALERVLATYAPDIVLLQETKATEDTFPFFDLKIAGYNAYIAGQKSYNGVAILSKEPLKDVQVTLPDLSEEPTQARFIEGVLPNGIHIISVYVPNGNPPQNDSADQTRLAYKLKWMEALNQYTAHLIRQNQPLILGGDFNVIERDTDVYKPEAYRTNALMVEPVRTHFAALSGLALTNVIRKFNPQEHTYSFWDFQRGAWYKNNGMLLDYLFVSDNLSERVQNAGIYKEVRGWDKTSDHAPIWCELA